MLYSRLFIRDISAFQRSIGLFLYPRLTLGTILQE
nr:MAG TPA_asm: hypothetical protein [Caudoviricetes sp.]DAV02309.1 MAG TPA: hypothetical protein [Caudoviricetes sp.]